MIEQELVVKLRANRKKVEELTRTLAVDLIDDVSYEESSLEKMHNSVKNCMGAVKAIFKKVQADKLDDSVAASVVLMNKGSIQDALLMLNRLARAKDVSAQLKLAEFHCVGISGVDSSAQNSEYGLKVLRMLMKNSEPSAFYTHGVYHKQLPDLPTATSNFEQSYNLGYIKAYTELVSVYKRQVKESGTAEARLLATQKLNNLKSELTYE